MDKANKTSLLRILNSCWREGIFSKNWKLAKLKTIRKSGNRDWTIPNWNIPTKNPVAHHWKIFERMITNRLNQHIEAHNLLIPFQLGFKAGWSTIDAVET